MSKGQKKAPLIPKNQLNQQEKVKNLKDNVVLDRKDKSQQRGKILFKGMMDGIGKAIEEMEKNPDLGAPTFNEMNDAFYRAGHAYNQRAMEEQWKNVEIVKE